MVIALVALSLAMIVGGALAIFQGWEIVLLERGWTLVIAGSVITAGGLLLLGLAAILARLGTIQAELAQWRERAGRAAMPAPPPTVDPVAALSTSLLAGGGLGAAAQAERAPEEDEAQPTLPLFMRRGEDERDEAAEPSVPVRDADLVSEEVDHRAEAGARVYEETPALRIPDYLFRGRDEERRPEAAPAVEPVADEPPPAPVVEAPPAAPEPALAPEPEPAPQPEEPARPVTVVGTYNSGGNRYVMYSDGSIEADTPQGVFRFASLDELKEFIASGGENPPAT